jgi:hypothetical protein
MPINSLNLKCRRHERIVAQFVLPWGINELDLRATKWRKNKHQNSYFFILSPLVRYISKGVEKKIRINKNLAIKIGRAKETKKSPRSQELDTKSIAFCPELPLKPNGIIGKL